MIKAHPRIHKFMGAEPAARQEVTRIARARAPARARKPRTYRSVEVILGILNRVAGGELLSQICTVPELPSRKAFFEWIAADADIRARYKLALQFRSETYADETIAIADDSSKDRYVDKNGNVRIDHEEIGRSKLRIYARLWYASKIAPKKYGNRQQFGVDMGTSLKAEELDARLAVQMRKAAGGR